jgi:hypothetical protein
LLCFPAEGPAVHIPPPATVFAVLCFVAGSAWNICSFSSHLVRYRPCIADWNKRQPSQYGGHWNTYKTCSDSRRSYTMVNWHTSILFIRQLIVVRKLEAFQNHRLELE